MIRVLHGRSFLDDPTRLLRALRYEARFGFRMDEQTERLAREAAAGAGALDGLGRRACATSCSTCCARRARRTS